VIQTLKRSREYHDSDKAQDEEYKRFLDGVADAAKHKTDAKERRSGEDAGGWSEVHLHLLSIVEYIPEILQAKRITFAGYSSQEG